MRDLPGLKTLTYTLLLAASPLTMASAMAQDLGSTWLDTINVTGTRTEKTVKDSPRSVTVIDKEELEKKPAESVAEMLRDIPGVDILTSSVAGMKRVRIRGEDSRRVTILVDGQEITDHSTYGTPFLTDPSVVERIDVIRGPASVLYGASAIGGVVNIITKKGGDKPVEAEISGSYFSATKGWQGSGSLFGSINNFDYRFTASMDDHGDRDVAGTKFDPTGKLQNSNFNNDNLSLHLGYRFGAADNHYISLKAEQHRLESDSWTDPEILGGPPSFRMNVFDLDLPQRDRKKIGLYYDGKDISETIKKVHFDAYYQTVDRDFIQKLNFDTLETEQEMKFTFPYNVTTTTETATNINQINRSVDTVTNYGGTAQIDLTPLPDHYLIGGMQYLVDELDTAKTTTVGVNVSPTITINGVETASGGWPATFTQIVTPNVPTINTVGVDTDKAEIKTTSFFLQDEWSLGDYWKATGGLRYYITKAKILESNHLTNVEDSTDYKLLKSGGLTFSGIKDTTVRWLYSEGYIYPTLLELFVPTNFGSRGTLYGNPDLGSESSYNLEFGIRYGANGLLVDAAAYRTVAEDYITSVSCSANPALCPVGYGQNDTVRDNADGATTWGVEASVQYQLPGTSLTPYVTGAWIKRRVEYANFSTMNNDVPEISGRYGIKYEWNLGSSVNGWADLYARSSSGVKLTESIGDYDELPGWTTLNLSVGLNMGEDNKYKLAVHLNNLTNKAYQATFNEIPAQARNVVVTARVKF